MRQTARFRNSVIHNSVIRFFAKPFAYAAVFAIVLTGVFVFTLLDAFVIPRALRAVPPAPGQMSERGSGEDSGVTPGGAGVGSDAANGDSGGTVSGSSDVASGTVSDDINATNSGGSSGTAGDDPGAADGGSDGIASGNSGGTADSRIGGTASDGSGSAADPAAPPPFGQYSAGIADSGSGAAGSSTETPASRQSPGTDAGAVSGAGQASAQPQPSEQPQPQAPEITATSYKDENISITVETVRAHDTDIHIADITLSAASYLKTAFAQDTYGRNIREDTSAIAAANDAIFAVNGDYYGFRENGWVLRNGVLYRSGSEDGALAMDAEGDLSCESSAALSDGSINDLWQIWSFGPPLVLDGEIAVSMNEEISGRSTNSNPRTAIGQAGKLRYIVIVSDGRTGSNAGLSLYELAELFQERDCAIAYNLDGGGSSTMYFDGRVVNNPTTGGRRTGEREVSDIVYIGY